MSNGGRPSDVPPAAVDVALEDHVLGTVTQGVPLRPFSFALPPDVADLAGETPRIRLRVSTWNPHQALGVQDTRDLGIHITRVDLQ